MRWNILIYSWVILAMSRCLPFPPPGYEKKYRPDEVNLIIKEKHKKKRHKDKKDKDKKGRNEERSEGKHKEDKDRKKKKHRDKKDRNKDKCRCSEEKKIVGPLENQNGEKLDDLRETVRNNDGATESWMVNKITLTEHREVNFLGKEEGNGTTSMQAESYGKIKYKRENGKMANGQIIEVGLRELGNGFVGNFSGENQNKVVGGSCQEDKFEKTKEKMEKNKNKKGRKEDKCKKDRDKNRKTEDKKRKKENKKEKVKERSKEKIKQTENDGNNALDFQNNKPSDLLKERCDSQGNLPKCKELEFSGFLLDSGIQPNNVPRPASSSHRICQNGSDLDSSQNIIDISVEKGGVIMGHNVNGKFLYSQSAIKRVRLMEPGQTANYFTAETERAAINNRVVSNGPISSQFVGTGRKMEPCQNTSNVAMMEQEVNRSRADDKVPSSHHVVENGRKMVRPNINQTVERQGLDASCKMDIMESKMNGIWEDHLCTSSRALLASAKAKKVDTCMKPPHPDSKYLNQLLTIPKVEWSKFDDQEWLFDCKNSQAKRPKLVSSQIEWTKHVWAKAIHVESADVTALPFVIPY